MTTPVAGARATLTSWHLIPLFVVVALVIPQVTGGSYLFTWTAVAIWVLFAMGTNVVFGWTGLLSFGQVAFFGIGGYTVAVLHDRLPDLPGPVLLLAALLLASTVAAVFAVGALRTSGPEFAVLTLVLAQVLWLLTYRVRALRGDEGFTGLSGVPFGGDRVLRTDQELWYYTIAVVGIGCFALWRLHRSTLGASMRAVRDDPWRAAALGYKVRRTQIVAFSVGGGLSAVAGGLMVHHQGVASPDLLGFAISGEVLVACLIGGLRIFWGPAMGAIVLVWSHDLFSGTEIDTGLFVGVLLLLIVLVLPTGLGGLPAAVRRRRRPARPPKGLSAPPPGVPDDAGSLARTPVNALDVEDRR